MIVRREADLEWNLYASILIETFDLLAIVLSVMLHLVSILSLFILIQFLFFFHSFDFFSCLVYHIQYF